MNPILLYPQNAAQAKFLRETAESKGVELINLPKEMLEEMEDWFLGAKMYERSKNPKLISNEELDATFERLIAGK